MVTFAERLKLILDQKGLSQAEAARLIGVTQQSINYIINNNLATSKMAPKFAESLHVNPEWLIFGKGTPESTAIYEIPIIHSAHMLEKFLANELKEVNAVTTTDRYLGTHAFAYLLQPTELIICAEQGFNSSLVEYLCLDAKEIYIAKEPESKACYPIFEWRKRYEKF